MFHKIVIVSNINDIRLFIGILFIARALFIRTRKNNMRQGWVVFCVFIHEMFKRFIVVFLVVLDVQHTYVFVADGFIDVPTHAAEINQRIIADLMIEFIITDLTETNSLNGRHGGVYNTYTFKLLFNFL
jgi:hypothetical protein